MKLTKQWEVHENNSQSSESDFNAKIGLKLALNNFDTEGRNKRNTLIRLPTQK